MQRLRATCRARPEVGPDAPRLLLSPPLGLPREPTGPRGGWACRRTAAPATGGPDDRWPHTRLDSVVLRPGAAGLGRCVVAHHRHLGLRGAGPEIGRASCRERVCQYV